ncbi:LysR family transcriptional regulator [Psychrosphaera algicola]|uniref:LysR family transcriptional regulator n=1 Tax=Psychrosphaera algicola TaxID=3023714 RepID=A0ABT5FB83_9GAMM|nr:LysR family transcriptional regulator [Psychrosphaera sp. G1-22]MDC2888197.1 LysR family transcriptional regulator [Psychrosphaera sp. G1-22]
MNIDQLKILQTIVRTGSINEAAKKLFKTQPALSMAIKRLECEIGFELFNRNKYRLELNEQGTIFYQRSQNILSELEQLKSLSDAFNQGIEHELTINIEGPAMLPRIFDSVKRVQEKFPHTQLQIHTEKLLHGLKNLASQEVDLTIIPWIDAFNLEGEFQTKPIDSLAFTFCIHKKLAANFGISGIEQITPETLKHIPQLSPTDMAFNLSDTPLLRKISHSIVKVDDIHCYIESLKAQLGWGPMMSIMVPTQITDDFWLFDLEPKDTQVKVEVRVVKNKNKILGPVAQFLWDSL